MVLICTICQLAASPSYREQKEDATTVASQLWLSYNWSSGSNKRTMISADG
uniref:Uncharacterized protein n=1 Tax=Rhizophora mucronata TaxID=61149 RepID=A0A2P2QXS3_RHIMU